MNTVRGVREAAGRLRERIRGVPQRAEPQPEHRQPDHPARLSLFPPDGWLARARDIPAALAADDIKCWADSAYRGTGAAIRVPFQGRNLRGWRLRHNRDRARIRSKAYVILDGTLLLIVRIAADRPLIKRENLYRSYGSKHRSDRAEHRDVARGEGPGETRREGEGRPGRHRGKRGRLRLMTENRPGHTAVRSPGFC